VGRRLKPEEEWGFPLRRHRTDSVDGLESREGKTERREAGGWVKDWIGELYST
jgi:hypothetical protein